MRTRECLKIGEEICEGSEVEVEIIANKKKETSENEGFLSKKLKNLQFQALKKFLLNTHLILAVNTSSDDWSPWTEWAGQDDLSFKRTRYCLREDGEECKEHDTEIKRILLKKKFRKRKPKREEEEEEELDLLVEREDFNGG